MIYRKGLDDQRLRNLSFSFWFQEKLFQCLFIWEDFNLYSNQQFQFKKSLIRFISISMYFSNLQFKFYVLRLLSYVIDYSIFLKLGLKDY